MVLIILLLAALIQVARCGYECFVRGSHGGASLGDKVQSADDCHQLIDAVSRKCWSLVTDGNRGKN
jgi:hypothetical protein